MTPKERAAALPDWFGTQPPVLGWLAREQIAVTIRDAENDALERAAVWLDSLDPEIDGVPDRDGIVEGIRAFKSK